MQFLVLACENRRFALSLEAVSEIVRGAWPVEIPRAPFGCVGALDVRGAYVPLLDLAAILGLRKGRARDKLPERLLEGHVVLVRVAEARGDGVEQVGLLVDRVLEVNEGAGVMVQGAPNGPASEGDRALLLDVESLFGQNRRRLLARALPSGRGAAA